MDKGRPSSLLLVVAMIGIVGMLAACGDGQSDQPDAAASSTPSGQSSSGSSPCWGEGPDNAPPSSSPDAEEYVGLTVKQAKATAKRQDQVVRVAGRDGECFPMTMDYRTDRVNLYIEGDQVVAATIG